MSFVLALHALHAGWPIEVVYWRLFSTEFSSTTPSSCSFSVFLHTPDRSRFLRSRIFSSPHGSGPFSKKRLLREETYSEPLADREDSGGNKNMRGSKHSSWGFRGVVITITASFPTTSDSRTPHPSPLTLLFPPVIFFYRGSNRLSRPTRVISWTDR